MKTINKKSAILNIVGISLILTSQLLKLIFIRTASFWARIIENSRFEAANGRIQRAIIGVFSLTIIIAMACFICFLVKVIVNMKKASAQNYLIILLIFASLGVISSIISLRRLLFFNLFILIAYVLIIVGTVIELKRSE